MFGDALNALADYVQGSLMLRANKRFVPPLGLNVLFLGRGRIYGDCLPRGPQFVCGGHLYYTCLNCICLKGCPRGLLIITHHTSAVKKNSEKTPPIFGPKKTQ